MQYLFESNIIYKDRKKKLTFKENFTISNQVFVDTFDVELCFLQKSELGKYIEDKDEFLAKGTIAFSYQFKDTPRHHIVVNLYLDYRKKYVKI